jgi:hypothetical protein
MPFDRAFDSNAEAHTTVDYTAVGASTKHTADHYLMLFVYPKQLAAGSTYVSLFVERKAIHILSLLCTS